MEQPQGNEGYGFPRPIRDADNALVECAHLLRLVHDTLSKIVDGCISFHVSVKFWPPGLEGKFEVKK